MASSSEQDCFGLARIVDQAEVVVERGARIDPELIIEHVVNIQHDLLRLGPCDHALKIVPRVADSDGKLLRADRAEGGGPAGLGDHDLSPAIFQLDLVIAQESVFLFTMPSGKSAYFLCPAAQR